MKRYFTIFMVLLFTISLSGCSSKLGAVDVNADVNADGNVNGKVNVNADENVNKSKDTASVAPGIVGYVTDKENGRILVINPDPQDFSANGGVKEYYEAIWFSNASEDIDVGEKVRVWFGAVRESYPAQSDIERIEVVPGQKPEGANLTEPEAVYKALMSQEKHNGLFLVVTSVKYQQASHEWEVQLKEAQGEGIYNIKVEDEKTSQSAAGYDTPQPLKLDDDLQLGKLKVNMTKQRVNEVMKSALTRSTEDSTSGIESEFLYFDDKTQVHLVEGKIYAITIAAADYATPRGLKVGDSAEDVQRLYGEPSYVNKEGTWVYSSRGYDVFFVTIQDGVVMSMKVSLVM